MCQAGLLCRDPALVRVLVGEVSVELGLWVVIHEDLGGDARCRAVFDALVEGLVAV